MRNQFYCEFDFDRPSPQPVREGDHRTPFQVDRDRIIHTSAFRALQNKTQVFLAGEYDFYRTRLTHSIEVSQIGRSICSRLQSVSDLLGDDCFVDPELVEAACLAHDLGHPPFGHNGESCLNRLMAPWGGFEGNAQTLRLLTETVFSARGSGMNPTRALLDGVLKYKTLHAELGGAEQPPERHFLYDAQDPWLDFTLDGEAFPTELTPGEVRDHFRSIECQITDWADDIAYGVNDIADGFHAGFIEGYALERWAGRNVQDSVEGEHVERILRALRERKIESLMGRKIGLLVAATNLVEEPSFLSGRTRRHRYRLEVDPAALAEVALYKRIALDLVFRSQQLQQLDQKADMILRRLFAVFADYYIEPDRPRSDHRQLLWESQEEAIFEAGSEAMRARLVCDAIARMTDSVATRTYQRLFEADHGSIADLL